MDKLSLCRIVISRQDKIKLAQKSDRIPTEEYFRALNQNQIFRTSSPASKKATSKFINSPKGLTFQEWKEQKAKHTDRKELMAKLQAKNAQKRRIEKETRRKEEERIQKEKEDKKALAEQDYKDWLKDSLRKMKAEQSNKKKAALKQKERDRETLELKLMRKEEADMKYLLWFIQHPKSRGNEKAFIQRPQTAKRPASPTLLAYSPNRDMKAIINIDTEEYSSDFD